MSTLIAPLLTGEQQNHQIQWTVGEYMSVFCLSLFLLLQIGAKGIPETLRS
jgi:hypothetical protein